MKCPKCNKNKTNVYNGTHIRIDGILYNVCDVCSNEIENKSLLQAITDKDAKTINKIEEQAQQGNIIRLI